MKRDEWFQLVRWLNLGIALSNFYYYVFYASAFMLPLGALNLAVFVFTRKTKGKYYYS